MSRFLEEKEAKEEILIEDLDKFITDPAGMMKAYVALKKNYLDTIVFYRLGDFYEMFFKDALTMSRVLELALTYKTCGNGQKTYMCGIPAKAVDIYLTRAVEAGFKVAICEQFGDPKALKGKQVMERAIVRVVTPGTIVESEALQGKVNNYIMSCVFNNGNFGLSWLDVSTGEFNCAEIAGIENVQGVFDVLTMVKPSEVVANKLAIDFMKGYELEKIGIPKFEELDDYTFDLSYSEDLLMRQLEIKTLKGLSFEKYKFALMSVGGLLSYIKDTQKRDLSHINNLKVYEMNNNMYLDYPTRKNLEVVQNARDGSKKGSILWLLDETQTSMGGRMLRKFLDMPLINKKQIDLRLNAVEELKNNLIKRDAIRDCLKGMCDFERLAGKISYGSLNPKECYALGTSLTKIPELKELLNNFKSKLVLDIINSLDNISEVSQVILKAIDSKASSAIKDGNFINKGFNDELDELRNLSKNSKSVLSALEAKEKELTGIKTLKLGYNRVFGYYWEISNSFKDMVPFRFIRKQTTINGERYITEELKELEEKILGAEEKAIRLEQDIYTNLRNVLLKFVLRMQKTSNAVALVDALVAMASVAAKNNYIKPKIKEEGELKIIGGRHPIVEKISHEEFIANDCILNNTDCKTMVITGPNMAGKSTYMRQVAIITLLAHIGSFVPAQECEIPITDRIFTRIGASDDLAYGQSTFMVEMVEVSNILKNATNRSLILLDEIGRGTATFDGLSIAWSVMEYVSKKLNAKTLFSTHYHELTELEGLLEGVKNFRVTVKEYNNSIIFLRKIVRGGANKSFGIEVAALAKLPEEVIIRAREILSNLEESDVNNNAKLSLLKIDNDTKNPQEKEETIRQRVNSLEICNMLKELNMDKLSPMEAFMILNDLSLKAKQ